MFLNFLDSSTNLRSYCYNIRNIHRYKKEKYALDINRLSPFTHSVIAGSICHEIYLIL